MCNIKFCLFMVMMLTTGIPNIAILAYQNKDKTDFDKSTDEYIFGDMAFWPLTIISLTFSILIFCPNSDCDNPMVAILLILILCVLIMLDVSVSTETFFSFWNVGFKRFRELPDGATDAIQGYVFATRYCEVEIYLLLFLLSICLIKKICMIIKKICMIIKKICIIIKKKCKCKKKGVLNKYIECDEDNNAPVLPISSPKRAQNPMSDNQLNTKLIS